MVPSQPSETRIPALDGLRGIAAIMVIAWHLTGSMVNRQGWSEMVYATTIFGRTGVDLFFVLSGFLIVGILIDRRRSKNLFSVFYVRRACRILPPYMVLIALYWLCFLLLGSSEAFNNDGFPLNLMAQASMLWNAAMSWADNGIARGFSITWSVNIEEHFYLVFPALVWVCPRERIAHLLVIIGLGSWAARVGFHLTYPQYELAPYVLTPFRLDGLCVGGLLALGYRCAFVWKIAVKKRVALLAAATVSVLCVPFQIALIRHELAWHMYLWGHAWLSVVYALVIAAVVLNAHKLSFLSSFPLSLAGRYSYSLYLFHPLFLSLFFVVAGRRELVLGWYDVALVVGSLAVTVAFCVALFETVEKRFQRLGHRHRYEAGVTSTALKPAG
ncbi:acyltransferase [Mesorhizobium sp. Z1-4]|uniref:acyltransferase family protein n=1 Tax=Mesorhizobium sp. Z1-4 TaxID=2448478 RepID=UPI000FDAE113|nr:acyltransferase [Mesorhizobium sp. Z1-4]